MKKFDVAGITVILESKKERQEIARKASKVKQDRTKKKFEEAVEKLMKEKKKITAYRIAKEANISYNTARKYMNETRVKLLCEP